MHVKGMHVSKRYPKDRIIAVGLQVTVLKMVHRKKNPNANKDHKNNVFLENILDLGKKVKKKQIEVII